MKKSLEKARKIREDLLTAFKELHFTVEAGLSQLGNLDGPETKAMLGPVAIAKKKTELRAAVDSTLAPILARIDGLKAETEALGDILTDPEVAARRAAAERLTDPWDDLPENSTNYVLTSEQIWDNRRLNRSGKLLSEVREELVRSRVSRNLERLPKDALFSRLDAAVAVGGESSLRDVGLILDELSFRDAALEDATRKAGALAKFARDPLFSEGAKLKSEIGKLADECRLTLSMMESGRPDTMRKLMFEHLTAAKPAPDVEGNPFKAGESWNLTKQGELVKTDPARAAALRAEAGV